MVVAVPPRAAAALGPPIGGEERHDRGGAAARARGHDLGRRHTGVELRQLGLVRLAAAVHELDRGPPRGDLRRHHELEVEGLDRDRRQRLGRTGRLGTDGGEGEGPEDDERKCNAGECDAPETGRATGRATGAGGQG